MHKLKEETHLLPPSLPPSFPPFLSQPTKQLPPSPPKEEIPSTSCTSSRKRPTSLVRTTDSSSCLTMTSTRSKYLPSLPPSFRFFVLFPHPFPVPPTLFHPSLPPSLPSSFLQDALPPFFGMKTSTGRPCTPRMNEKEMELIFSPLSPPLPPTFLFFRMSGPWDENDY